MRYLLIGLGSLALVFAATHVVSAGYADDDVEYKVKAGMLYNFAKFVEWQTTKLTSEGDLHICILGQDPFGAILNPIERKKIRNHSIRVHRITSMGQASKCHVVFVSQSEKDSMAWVLKELGNNMVLTVSDIDAFAQKGGMIGFVKEGERIRFEINTSQYKRAGIKIHAKLLELAILRE